MKIKNLLFIVVACLLSFQAFVFAEGDTECSGRITGMTLNENFNEGSVSFDSHEGYYVEDGQAIDLGVWGLMPGLAPFSREYAACVEESGDGHAIRGYAAGTNIGMISFSCIDGKNDAGFFKTVSCSIPNHEVLIKNGELSGYAWSPVLGWINFEGVSLVNGILSGSADTQSLVDVNFDGVKVYLSGAEYDSEEEYSYCDSWDEICITVIPDPFSYTAVADSEDGYDLVLEIKGLTSGQFTKDSLQDYQGFLDSISFEWQDTVSLDQIEGDGSAVIDLPNNLNDFNEQSTGYFVTKNKIKSFAPTSLANKSFTTSTDPRYKIFNEAIYKNNTGKELSKNNLILKRVEYADLYNNDGEIVVGKGEEKNVVYANGKPDLNLLFQPAISVQVFANDLKDRFLAFAEENLHIDIDKKIISHENEELKLFVGSNEACDFSFVDGGYELTKDFESMSLDLGVKTEEVNSALDCNPYFYSLIEYELFGKSIRYVSDGLPRIIEKESIEPLALIQGNIRGQSVVDKRYEKNWHGYLDVSTNQLRNAITKNSSMILRDKQIKKANSKVCTITSLSVDSGNPVFNTNCETANYNLFSEYGENVLYFKDAEKIIVDQLTYDGKWIIISDNSNIFIDGDILNKDLDSSLSLISLRGSSDWAKGNIYIGTCDKNIKNVEAILYADSLVTSANEDMNFVNGEPQFNSYFQRTEMLDCPLKTRSIYGKVTVGGSDLDKNLEDPKNYLVLGNGELLNLPLSADERMRAQLYDLNYLRMYTPFLEKGAGGCPIDQSENCKAALCAEEIALIASGENVCGEVSNETGECTIELTCDGINPNKVYESEEQVTEKGLDTKLFGPDGDLIIEIQENEIPVGLEIEKEYFYYPLYIEFVEPESFIFRYL